MFKLSKRSLINLEGVHEDLVAVVKRALETSEVDFTVVEGRRTVERQNQLVKDGASKTMYSRHLTGHAVDLYPFLNGKLIVGKDPKDWPLFQSVSKAMKQAAEDLDVEINWGGDWKSFKDGPHFELDREFYP